MNTQISNFTNPTLMLIVSMAANCAMGLAFPNETAGQVLAESTTAAAVGQTQKANSLHNGSTGPIMQEELATILQKKLDSIVESKKFPGATLSVVLPDGQVIDLASGYEDPEAKTTMSVGAKMFCGSTGKTFVSAVALQLVAEGKIDLDALAQEYFKDNADREWYSKLPNADSMTVRSLLNHTSGLPRYIFQESFMEDLKANPLKSRDPKESLSVLHGVAPIHEVGKGWAYSDSNFQVIGLIIERVTGKAFFDVAKERLLGPQSLKATEPTTQPRLEGLIQGHIGSANPFGLPKKTVSNGSYALNPDFEWCGGGFITNTNNLARWMQVLHTKKVINNDMHQQLVSAVDFRSGLPAEQGYGLGAFVWDTDMGKFFGHSGIMPGYLTQIEFSEQHQFSIAFQTNTDDGMGRGLHEFVQSVAKLVIENID